MFRITVIGKLWARNHFDTEFHFVTGSAVARSVCQFGVLEGRFFSFISFIFVPCVYLKYLLQRCDFLLL